MRLQSNLYCTELSWERSSSTFGAGPDIHHHQQQQQQQQSPESSMMNGATAEVFKGLLDTRRRPLLDLELRNSLVFAKWTTSTTFSIPITSNTFPTMNGKWTLSFVLVALLLCCLSAVFSSVEGAYRKPPFNGSIFGKRSSGGGSAGSGHGQGKRLFLTNYYLHFW